MRAIVITVAGALVSALASCASGDSGGQSSVSAACPAGEPRTGTSIVRRDKCIPTTAEEREAARRQAELLQAEQDRIRNNSRKGN